MTTTKKVAFTINDSEAVNKILQIRGTLFVEINMLLEDSDILDVIEITTTAWKIVFKSSFTEEMTSVSSETEEMLRELISENISDQKLWQLNAGIQHDLSDFIA